MGRLLTGEAETDIKYKIDVILEMCPQYTNTPDSDMHNLVELKRVKGRIVKCMLNIETLKKNTNIMQKMTAAGGSG